VVLELGIFASHIIWLIRTYKVRKQAREQGKTFDDITLEHEELGIPFKFAERKSRKERRARREDDGEGTVEETRTEQALQAVAGGESSADESPERGGGIGEKHP
jgi:uncharacterized protein YpiB (UPF0302 family)